MSRQNEQKSYHPSDVYLPLLDRDGKAEKIIELLIDRASPFLPVRVLRPDKKESVIGDVSYLRRYLWHPKSVDRVVFKSREKDDFSTVLKILNYQSLYERCMATLSGMKTNMTKRYARRKLSELRRRMERRHRRGDFETKPVGIDSIDDSVGFSLAIDLQKPLEEYGRDERVEVNEVFRALAKYLVKKLKLQHPRRENHLWSKNRGNRQSAENFRVYKIHGDYEIEVEAFEGGRLVMTKLFVPVEIQLCPVESRLRMFYPGEVGEESYAKRKAADVEGFLFPRAIGGKPIYPATDVSSLLDEVLTGSVVE